MSTDDRVRSFYGDGVFVRDEGHVGGRYWTDRTGAITLHSVVGVDNVIEQVSLTAGLDPPRADHEREASVSRVPTVMVSGMLDPVASLEGGIRLGDSPERVLQAYGAPNRDETTGDRRTIEDTTDDTELPYVLVYSASFEFLHGKLQRAILYEGE